jgi:hypothetical protein
MFTLFSCEKNLVLFQFGQFLFFEQNFFFAQNFNFVMVFFVWMVAEAELTVGDVGAGVVEDSLVAEWKDAR